MRSALAAAANRRAGRSRVASISAIPPSPSSSDFHPELAVVAASILYQSPLPTQSGRPLYILNAAAFPDAHEVDYDTLLSYVLARLPGEDELLSGTEYEIVFFAGGPTESATSDRKQGPGMGWYLQAYHVLSRALRKKLQRLYIVHPRTWVRVLIGVFGTIVSPKFRRKIVTCNTLSALALQIPVDRLLIPPSTYLHDRKLSPDIDVPYASGRRAFGTRHPLPKNINTGSTRLPRVLRETTYFLLLPPNVRTEGIFRIPPHAVLVGVLKEAYDRGQRYIVWKEPDATFVEPGLSQAQLDEVRVEDAYGAHLAASLIKTWYRELRDPIFPEDSYELIRQNFGPRDSPINAQDLMDILSPTSTTSPLRQTSREILTRHLLPLLSTVVQHESGNKMNAENLAICFSMALVCGTNQMEDAKFSTVIKRILEAAIKTWPDLRAGLGIDEQAFHTTLQPPVDHKDYEDPLVEHRARERFSEDDSIEGLEEQRIFMSDSDGPGLERAPTLPPRRSSKPAIGGGALPLALDVSQALKRKPAPSPTSPSANPSPKESDPPRYSVIFGGEGQNVRASPASATAEHPASQSHRDWASADPEKKGFAASPPTVALPVQPDMNVPKRKAVNSSKEENQEPPPGNDAPRHASEANAALARMAAEKAAAGMNQRIQIPAPYASSDRVDPVPSPGTLPSPVPAASPSETIFHKPAVPASAARQQQQTNIHSLARPHYPSLRSPTALSATSSNSNGLSASLPKMRSLSPGLLARMSSMELGGGSSDGSGGGGGDAMPARPSLAPGKLNLRKSSVDDLRRLYEERTVTAQGLARADAVRRGSSAT